MGVRVRGTLLFITRTREQTFFVPGMKLLTNLYCSIFDKLSRKCYNYSRGFTQPAWVSSPEPGGSEKKKP